MCFSKNSSKIDEEAGQKYCVNLNRVYPQHKIKLQLDNIILAEPKLNLVSRDFNFGQTEISLRSYPNFNLTRQQFLMLCVQYKSQATIIKLS